MKKAERTRQFILERTAPLFNTKGYAATTLSDLTEATGLTKGSLYGNFESKDAIAQEAFRYAVDTVRKMVRLKLEGVSTYKKQLIALIEFYAEYVFDPPVAGGCPLFNSAVEADDHLVSMRRVVARELLNTVNFIANLLEKGRVAGEFRKDIKPHELAYTFFCAIEGAIIFARIERSHEPMNIIVKHCKNILNQISK